MLTRTFARDPEWIVILAGVAAALHIGKMPPAIPVLREALGVSLLQAGFLLSLVQLAGMVLGLVVGAVADGIGLKRSMVTGLLLLSLAGALGALARDPASLLLLRACEGFGILLTVMPAPGLIRRLAPRAKLQVALGLWGAYMPFGTALALAVGPALIGVAGWPIWWLCIAAVSLAMAAWLHLAVESDVKNGRAATSTAGTADRTPAAGISWIARARWTLSAPGPWLAALCFALYSGQWLAVIGFLPSMASQGGQSGAGVAWLLALVALVNMVGNIASGRLLQRGVPARSLLFVGFGAMAAGAVLAFADIAWTQSPGSVLGVRYLGLLLFSAVGGMVPGTLFSVAVQVAPSESCVSTTVGWMQQLSALGQFLGPPLVAWVAATTGGWHWTWAVTGASCVLGAMVAHLIGRQLVDGPR